MFVVIVEGQVPCDGGFLVLNLDLSLMVFEEPPALILALGELHQNVSTLSVEALPLLRADGTEVLLDWQSAADPL